MSDLEKFSTLFDSVGIEYEFLKRVDFTRDADFFGAMYSEYPDVNEIIVINSGFFYSQHWFKDGKFVEYHIFE